VSTVNMLEAKTNLSRLVEAGESGAEDEIVIARNGRPAARLVAVNPPTDVSRRIGLAKGRFKVPDDFDQDNELIRRMFEGQ
jgi:antitoxin (DNA-binding transcriptional repressor) of toxin-antitoxin stability system